MGFLENMGKGLVDGLQNISQGIQDKFNAEKREYDKKIFFKDVLLDKKYDFDLKVEENKLTFTNHSGIVFFRTLHNSPLFIILVCTAMLGFIMLAINGNSEFTCLFMLMIVGSILSAIFIFTFFKTKAYFTVTPQGIEVKTKKSRLFIDRDNISDVYLDVQGLVSEGIVREKNKRAPIIVFTIYLKTLQEIYLPDLKKNKSLFDFFYSDHNQLSKLFVIVVLTEIKRILNLPRQNEFFETGLKNITILKSDNSEFVFEKANHGKITINKYKVKIENNGNFGNNKNRELSIQNNSSLRIFEAVRRKTNNSLYNIALDMMDIQNNNFGLALCEEFSSNKPNILVNDINLDEALYILRKIRAYVGRN